MLNKIFLQGRLVVDPELRQTPNGVSVCSFRIAVDRDFKNKQTGERKTDFITVVAWRQTAEFIAQNFSKSRMTVVEGRLQIRQYTDKDENKRTVAEVVAENIYFGDSKPSGGTSETRPASHPTSAQNAARSAPTGQQGQFEELDDEGDLPF